MPRSDPREDFGAQSEIGLPKASPAWTWSFQFLDFGRVLGDILQPISEQISRVVFYLKLLIFLKSCSRLHESIILEGQVPIRSRPGPAQILKMRYRRVPKHDARKKQQFSHFIEKYKKRRPRLYVVYTERI